MLTSQCL